VKHNQSTADKVFQLNLDGPMLRAQRELLLRLQCYAAARVAWLPTSGDADLIDRLIGLTDALADQAHDQYGIDCLLEGLVELGVTPSRSQPPTRHGEPTMRFEPGKCPECGEYAKGTFETVPGLALLNFVDDGEAEYFGQTDVCWDMQTTDRDEQGHATLMCPAGHTWQAAMT